MIIFENAMMKLPKPLFVTIMVIVICIFMVLIVLSASILSKPEAARAWLEQWGVVSGLVFWLLQCLQVVFFAIPGEVLQIAGGLVFGVETGTLLSLTGMSAGGVIAFLVARKLGKTWLDTWMDAHKDSVWTSVIHDGRFPLILFVVFLVPLLPKDILCYMAGVTSMKLKNFFWITFFARIPSLWWSSVVGSTIQDVSRDGMNLGVIVVFVSTIVVVGLVFIFRHKIQEALLMFKQGADK